MNINKLSKKDSYNLLKKLKIEYNLISNLKWIGSTTQQIRNETSRIIKIIEKNQKIITNKKKNINVN